MQIDLSPAGLAEKPILARLLQLYLYDFTEFDGEDLNPAGLYEYPYFDQYWQEAGRSPLLIHVDGRLAGFALVRRLAEDEGGPASSMAEFFILRKYRRLGVGSRAAKMVFQRFPGRWHIAVLAENQPARLFWRKVVQEYTRGDFTEVIQNDELWKGLVLFFHQEG